MNQNQAVADDQMSTVHDKSITDICNSLTTNQHQGLADHDATQRLQQHGPNQLYEAPAEPLIMILLRQFKSIVVLVLVIAAILSGVIGEWFETWAILSIVIMNGFLGFFQESKAEKALATLKKLSAPQARVVRAGLEQSIPARDLVIGDLILVAAGDFIPADARLVACFSFRTQEASLTGESEPVSKNAADTLATKTNLAERSNMIFAGTTALSGQASAIVTATGMQSELGKIAKLLKQEHSEPTPLQRRLAELGRLLMVLCLVIVAIVAGLQWLRGGSFHEIFIFAVSLAVAAVPEGLPAVVTISLAFGLTRMAKRNALIRRLPSVETLGSVTVICSDKTGTLTRNEMTVRNIVAGDTMYNISGSGYKPVGTFTEAETKQVVEPAQIPDLKQVLTIGLYCNHANLKETEQGWQVLGDPTEGALIVLAKKASLETHHSEYSVIYEIPFDADRKMMSVIVKNNQDQTFQFVKGAPEVLLNKCSKIQIDENVISWDQGQWQQTLEKGQNMAQDAMRVLALAFKKVTPHPSNHYPEEELIFAGLVGMIDPPRMEVKDAVTKCKRAGITPVMITGDHPATGQAIAQELGISHAGNKVVTGHELDTWDEDTLYDAVDKVSVYARVTPEHKLRVVKAWKKRDQIVAMTGDGVNDAPAVKAADIGIAMGITGTDVTKEASAMVLTDDNFTSIVNAVEEGRGIFANIQNIIQFLLAGNTGEILLVLIAALAGWPTPLIAMQILWINLVTDGLPALALATEFPEKGIMSDPPRPVHEPIFTWHRGLRILTHGALLASVSLLGYWWTLFHDKESAGNVTQAQAVAFCICAFGQLAYSFACRSRRFTLPEIGFFSNKPLLLAVLTSVLLQLAAIFLPGFQQFFFSEIPNLNMANAEFIAILSLIPVTFIELLKLITLRLQKRGIF